MVERVHYERNKLRSIVLMAHNVSYFFLNETNVNKQQQQYQPEVIFLIKRLYSYNLRISCR